MARRLSFSSGVLSRKMLTGVLREDGVLEMRMCASLGADKITGRCTDGWLCESTMNDAWMAPAH